MKTGHFSLARHIDEAGGAQASEWPGPWWLGALRLFAIAAATFAVLWAATAIIQLAASL